MFDNIETIEDWWQLVDKHWNNILVIGVKVGVPIEQYKDLLEKWKQERNIQMANFLENVWENAPDEPIIHSWKGWEQLCNLCAESYLLYPTDCSDDDLP